MQKASPGKFRTEKVIKRKGDKLYIKWKGYDNSFNIWIDKKDLVWKWVQPSQFARAKGNCLHTCFGPCQLRQPSMFFPYICFCSYIMVYFSHRLKWKNGKNIFLNVLLNVCRLYNIKSFMKKCYLSHNVFSCYYHVLSHLFFRNLFQ